MPGDKTGKGGLSPTMGNNPDDTVLLAKAAQGSEDALVGLHRRYVSLVYSLAFHILGDRMATEEVTQDVFIKLWEHPRSYDPTKGRFSSWLLTVTRHAAIDFLRKQGRRPTLVSTWDGQEQPDAGEQMTPNANRHPNPDLRIMLRRLPADQRQVIEMAYFGGMSQQDIAEYVNLPLGTVKTRMRLGVQQLRGMWEAMWEQRL